MPRQYAPGRGFGEPPLDLPGSPTMDFDVDARTIFLTLSGSHAYGTARAGSDVDVRGCCIAPLALRLSFRHAFEQLEWPRDRPLGPQGLAAMQRAAAHPSAGMSLRTMASGEVPDFVVYELAKLVALCARQNPNTLELLFVDPREILLTTDTWERVRAQRRAFLSQKVRHTFTGYAKGQLDRIRRHRQWLLSPPKQAPTRADFGLPEQSVMSADERNQIEEAITKVLRSWSVDEGIELEAAERDVLRERMREFWAAGLHVRAEASDELELALADRAGESLGLGRAVLHTLRQERRYRAARAHWEQFLRWQRERNPARAALEAEHGYDTKHGMHLIRLLRMGAEILETGEVVVRRTDAAELLDIRGGKLDYDSLLEQAEALEQRMRVALGSTPLPVEVDEAALDRLLVEILLDAR